MFNLRIYRYNIGLVTILIIYLFAILLLFCFRIIILDSDQDNLALVLGLISIGVSILSLMLASQSYIKFEGKIYCWNVAENEIVRELNFNHGTFKEINFVINNYKKKVIRGLFISIRHPKNLKYGKKTENFDIYDYKKTRVLSNSKIKFLGNSNGDCTFTASIYLKDIELNKNRKIFISVSGDNIDTTTFIIDKELFEKIKSSNSTNKISLPKA